MSNSVPDSVVERLRSQKAEADQRRESEEKERQETRARERAESHQAGRTWAIEKATLDDLEYAARWELNDHPSKQITLARRVGSGFVLSDPNAFIEGACEVWEEIKGKL